MTMPMNDNLARARVRLKRSALLTSTFTIFGFIVSLTLIFLVPSATVLIILGTVAWILLGVALSAAYLAFIAMYDANAATDHINCKIAELEKQVAAQKAGLDAIANQYTTLRTNVFDQLKIDSRRNEVRLDTLDDEIWKVGQSMETLVAEQRRARHATKAGRFQEDEHKHMVDQVSDE
jgi:uncharacterized protein YoxC